MEKTFYRRNGEKLTIKMEIDQDKLIETLARIIAIKGLDKITRLDGSIIATIVGDE